MNRRLIFSVLAMAAASLAAPALAADAVRIGTEGAYPPYNFINENGEVDGFEREVGDEICKRAELTCTWVKNDWDSIIPNLVSGNFDMIMAGMTITAERDAVIDFTQDYFPPDPSAYVALKGAGDDVIHGVVASQTASIQAAHVAESDATLMEFATFDDSVAAVRNGEADAVLADRGFLEDIVNESDGEMVFVGPDVEIGDGIGVGVRESDGDLKARLDAAISSMKEDGSLNVLLSKWFDGMDDVY
ncbi:transporter substrate-binding domain-containing protein [Paludibacillus litoralis]|uniref:transporter substrate-binding domain-containing protein n=1 Tax=Paludibacillus litoralis TaxID=3133267 RepID=UPI0039B77723